KWSWFTNQVEQVRLVVDDDGDGKADGSTIFAGEFRDPLDGLASGVIARDGNVYLTSIPHLWLLKDEDGDGEAEVRKSLQYGFGVRTALLGHDLHGLVWGPDGKLYFSIGDRGYYLETKEGKVFHNPGSGAVFRCDPDGSNLEEFARGLRNPQELAFDQYGNLWTGDNNSDAGDRARLVYVVEGGETGWHMSYQTLGGSYSRGPWHLDKLWHTQHEGQAAWVIPPIAYIGGGPSGLAYYPGVGLDPRYENHFFMCDFHGAAGNSRIESWTVKPKGAGFEMVNSHTFLNKLLATDVTFGYDGKIYISDWIHGWGGTRRGRIYTLHDPKHIDDPAVRETKKIFAEGFRQRSNDELGKLLHHAHQSVRQRAQFELASRGDVAIATFRAVIEADGIPGLHGVWGLGQIGSANALTGLRNTFADSADERLCQTVKVFGDRGYMPVADDLVGLLKHESLRIRFFAAMALGKLKHKAALDPILEVLRENADQDVFLRHACVMGLMGVADPDTLFARASDSSRSVRLAVLLALRRHKDPRIALFLKDADEGLVTEAARAINDVPIPDAMPALADALTPGNPSRLRRAINANFRLGTVEGIRRLAALAGDDRYAEAMRQEAIAALSDWVAPSPRDRVLGYHRPLEPRDEQIVQRELASALPGVLTQCKGRVEADATRLASKYKISMDKETFLAWVNDQNRPVENRIAALRFLAGRKQTPEDAEGLKTVAEGALDSDQPRLRIEARNQLIKLHLRTGLKTLEQALESGEVIEKQAALQALSEVDGPTAMQLVKKYVIDREPDLEVYLEAMKAAQRHRFTLKPPGEGELAPYRVALKGGNAERGAEVFRNHTAAQCFRCHKVDGEGAGEAGPDLGKIGGAQAREAILESIVMPSKQIAKGYGMTVLTLKDGSAVVGTIISEQDGTIVVAPPAQPSVTVEADQVAGRISQNISGMPPMGEILKREELRDLIEFLAHQK
ncbi:MAG: PVC-type heme-binding CxxCH protein, partial [Verrucomicrobiota bacterium]